MELTIDDLAGLGDGVGRLPDGEAVIVPGTAPGDVVRVAGLSRRGGVLRAGHWTLRAASVDRVEPACALAGRCGGCGLQHVALERQRAWKRGLAARTVAVAPPLADTSAGDPAQLAEYGHAPALGWRRRARLHLRRVGGRLALGLMARASPELVAVDACPQLEPFLSAWLPSLRAFAAPFVEQGELALTLGREGAIAALDARLMAGAAAPSSATLAALLALPPPAGAAPLVGFKLRAPGVALSMGAVAVTLHDDVALVEDLAAPPQFADAAGFAQASAEGNRAIRRAVAAALAGLVAARGARFGHGVELYAGAGNLTPLLLDAADAVATWEAEADAVERARLGLSDALVVSRWPGRTLTIAAGDAGRAQPHGGADAVWLLDPGRPGAAEVCALAEHLRPAALVYVSCAADTLRRDLRALAAAGYRRQSAAWVDAMPHTPHLELIVGLRRLDDVDERR